MNQLGLEIPRSAPVLSVPVDSAIFEFWESAFRNYRRPLVQGIGFHVPQFPFPLLSPNFVVGNRKKFLDYNRGLLAHFNEVVPLGHGQRELGPEGFCLERQFFLCEKRLLNYVRTPEPFSKRVQPMRAALQNGELLPLLEEGFPKNVGFLQVLLPFLCTLEAEFHTVFLQENGVTRGAISVGVSSGIALVLNAVVRGEHRGRGLGTILTNLAQNTAITLGAERAFFWTDQAHYGKHADLIQHYRIFTKI